MNIEEAVEAAARHKLREINQLHPEAQMGEWEDCSTSVQRGLKDSVRGYLEAATPAIAGAALRETAAALVKSARLNIDGGEHANGVSNSADFMRLRARELNPR